MNTVAVVLLMVGGLLAGAVLGWLAARAASSVVQQRKSELEQEVAGLRADLAKEQQESASLGIAKATVEATLDSERKSTKEKLEVLNQASEEMRAQFQVLASTALESNNSSFLTLATSTLQTYQAQAAGELAQKEQAVKGLVDPLAQSLQELQRQIHDLEQARNQAYGSLSTQVVSLTESQKALQVETGNLVRALRDPQTRGRWGELQLRKVLELAGMLDYCDFVEQVSVTSEDGRLRPDVVVRLPGAKNVIIDSKVPFQSYLGAVAAPDEATREQCLLSHARQVRNHIDDLLKKAYWAQFQPTPEFVLMFLPGEVFFRAAIVADPELLERGEGRVILTSPMTLIAVLKSVAYGWNQKNLADSAKKISEAGKQLYERLCTMAGHMESLGTKLDGAVKSYNDTLSSLEKRVLPSGRRMAELDRSLSAEELPELEPIDRGPQRLGTADWRLRPEPDEPALEPANDDAKV